MTAPSCRPTSASSAAARPALNQPAWPFGREELDVWYEPAQEVCRLGPFDYDPASWDRQYGTGPALPGSDSLSTELFQTTFPMPFGTFYLEDLRAAPRLQVLLWANAVQLSTADVVESVLADSRDEIRGQYERSEVVEIDEWRIALLEAQIAAVASLAG